MNDRPQILGVTGLTPAGYLGPFLRWRGIRGVEAVEAWTVPANRLSEADLASALQRASTARHPALWQPLTSGTTSSAERFVLLPSPLPEDLGTLGGGRPLPADEVARLGCAVAGALAALHASDIALGTAQPSHLRYDPATGRVQIPVLAIAVREGPHPWIAPEVEAGSHDPARSDQYLVGLLIYAAATGVWPVDAPSGHPFPPMASRAPGSAVPRRIEAVAWRMAHPDPSERFDAMGDALDVLTELARRPGPPPGTGRPPIRSDVATRRLPLGAPRTMFRGSRAIAIGASAAGAAVLAAMCFGAFVARLPAAPEEGLDPDPVARRVPGTRAEASAPEPVASTRPISGAFGIRRDKAPPLPEDLSEPLATMAVPNDVDQTEITVPPSDAVPRGGTAPRAVPPLRVEIPTLEPPIDALPASGVYRGRRLVGTDGSGRGLELELDFAPDGGVTGRACVIVGPRKEAHAVVGTWVAEGTEYPFTLVEPDGPRPVTYRGAIGADGRAWGTWQDRGRDRGSWHAERGPGTDP